MATPEQMQLAMDFLRNLQGLRVDMRRNAQGYKAAVAAGQAPLAQIIAVMQGDAAQYLTPRLSTYCQRIVADPMLRAKLATGMTSFGILVTDLQALYNELKAAADAFSSAAATLATAADVNAASDALLASVAANDTVWG